MSAKSAACLIISAFPPGDDLWQVAWFGQTDFPDRPQRNRQASVCVSLSRVSLLSALTPFGQPPLKCWVSVGTLVMLRIGDCYRKRRYVGPGEAESETFADIEVDPPGTELIKAGNSEGGQFLLPLAHHPNHRDHTQGYCVRVPLGNGRQLLVPCMELVRFYFGSSGALLSQLFRPELRRTDLYDPKRSFVRADRSRSHLHLAPGLPGRSAADVARIASDTAAWRSAARIGQSMATPHNQGYIRTGFPFSGRTTLQARGQWLPLGDQPRRTFVVHQLLSCSHPLPFKSLSYRATPFAWQSTTERRSKLSNSGMQVGQGKGTETPTLVEQDAGRFGGQSFHVSEPQRFPDLTPKVVYRKQGSETAPAPQHLATSTINDLALGEPGSSKRIRPAEIEAHPLKEPPAFLHPIIEVLQEIPDLRFRPLTNRGEDGWTIAFENILEDLPDPLRWISVAAVPPVSYRRRMAILKLEGEAQNKVWVIVEHDRLVLCSYPAMEFSDEVEVARCSRLFADGFSWFTVGANDSCFNDERLAPLSDNETIRVVLGDLWQRECAPSER